MYVQYIHTYVSQSHTYIQYMYCMYRMRSILVKLQCMCCIYEEFVHLTVFDVCGCHRYQCNTRSIMVSSFQSHSSQNITALSAANDFYSCILTTRAARCVRENKQMLLDMIVIDMCS